MHKLKALESLSVNDDSESDSESDNDDASMGDIPAGNHIDEGINNLINDLPQKLTRSRNNDVLLKVDINKLNPTSIKYKNSR